MQAPERYERAQDQHIPDAHQSADQAQVEQIYERSGLTLTDAINCFLQQSINVGGLPLSSRRSSQEALRNVAIAQLMTEIRKGRDSVKSESDWVSEEEMRARLVIDG